MPSTTHTPTATSWPYVGDPSAAQLLPRAVATASIKLTGLADERTREVLERAGYFFRDNFSGRLCPESVRVWPEARNWVEIRWPDSAAPSPETVSYAKGVVAGMLYAAGHDIA